MAHGQGSSLDVETFIGAFKDVPKVELFSARDLQDEMKACQKILMAGSSENEFKRVDSLKRIRSLIVAGAANYDEFYPCLQEITGPLKMCVKGMSYQETHEACITIAYMCQQLGDNVDHFCKPLFPSLFNLIDNSFEERAMAGIFAIRFLIKHTNANSIIPQIIGQINQKSKVIRVRRAASDFLNQVLHTRPTHSLERHIALLKNIFKKGLLDADAEARTSFGKAFIGFHYHFKEQANILLKSLGITKERLLVSLHNSSSSISLQDSCRAASFNASSTAFSLENRSCSGVLWSANVASSSSGGNNNANVVGSSSSSSSTGHGHGHHGHTTSTSNSRSSSVSVSHHGSPLDFSSKYSMAAPVYPVHPDVKLRRLPFYFIIAELLKPASLVPITGSSRFQETNFAFHLTPQQANDIAISRDFRPGAKMEYSTLVQMRFCLLETSCEQDDNFPPSICVKVNNKMCPLPGARVQPKRPSRPINITFLCNLSPSVTNVNIINVSWTCEKGRGYAVAVYLVKRLTSADLIQKLKAAGIRNADHTRAMIKEKMAHDSDSDIATTSLRVSLMCPLGKMRMQIPCRAITCTHLQCFDASLYIQMNEKKPTWMCPVCDKLAPFDALVVDGLFMEIFSATTDCTEIQFHDNGAWSPMQPKKELHMIASSPESGGAKSKATSSSCGGSSNASPGSIPKANAAKFEIVDLTLDSSDDDCEPPRKSPALSIPSLPVSTSSHSLSTMSSLQSSNSGLTGASAATRSDLGCV